MPLSLLLLYLLLTFATSALLVSRLLLPAKRTIAAIGLLVFWLCNLIVPIQWLAFLNLAGPAPFLRVGYLFFWSGLAFAGALMLWRRRWKLPRGKEFEPKGELHQPIPRHVLVGLLLVLCTYGVLVLRMAFSFPDSWDSLAYHYPLALGWLQQGTMTISTATNWRASLPGNVEILEFLVLSTRYERLLGLVQWPGLAILLLAALHLGRRLGESPAPAWPVATTTLMIPIVANQSISGYVDLFGTALLFGSLTLLLEYCDQVKANRARPGLMAAAGLACGLAVGAKTSFWPPAALLLLGVSAFLLWWQRGWVTSRAWGRIAVFLIAAATPSLFWFARATFCTGNPCFPFAIHVGSFSLPGVATSEMLSPNHYVPSIHWTQWFAYPWAEWKRDPGILLTNYMVDSGLGGAFATFATPGLAFACWLAGRRRKDLRIWLIGFAVLAVVWWGMMMNTPRYGLPLFVCAVVMSAPFFDVLETGSTRLYKSIYVLAFAITALLLMFPPLHTIVQTLRLHTWSRAAYLGYPGIIDELKPGSSILNLGPETLNFPLAGKELTNRVIASWERPSVLTADYLRSRQVDYVLEKRFHKAGVADVDQGPPAQGLKVYFSSSVKEGAGVAEWRIWSASHIGIERIYGRCNVRQEASANQ